MGPLSRPSPSAEFGHRLVGFGRTTKGSIVQLWQLLQEDTQSELAIPGQPGEDKGTELLTVSVSVIALFLVS